MPSGSGQLDTLVAIRQEAWDYATRKPGKVPPADSPSRPHLLRLWHAAHQAASKRRNLKTFTYAGWRFGVIYWDRSLCVLDLRTRNVLVRHPASLSYLTELAGRIDTR